MHTTESHSSRRGLRPAGFLLAVMVLTLAPGCVLWHDSPMNPVNWDLEQYRDSQALDINRNLSREKPVVSSPFEE